MQLRSSLEKSERTEKKMKYQYLPEAKNDFAFAFLGSKTEFVLTSLAIIAGIAIIIFIAKRKK